MLTATQHERIDRYLAELAGALGDLPEGERDDVIAGVREHIQAALADRRSVTDADVDEVLRALGDPLTIAAEATGDDGGSGGPAVVTPEDNRRREVPVLQRDWVPGAVVVALLVGALVLPFLISFGGVLLLPFLLVTGWALLWISPLWTVGEKVAGTFLLPAAGVVFFTFTFLAWGGTEVCSSSGGSDGTYNETCRNEGGALTPLAAWAVIAAVAAAGIVTAVVLYRNGRRRAAAAAQSFSTGA